MTQVVTTGWPDRLLTLEDWQSLPADELHHVECSEGVLIVTPKPFPRHQRALVRLAHDLDAQLPEHLSTVGDVEVLLSPNHRLDSNGAYEHAHTYRGRAEVAISDTTVRVDLDALSSP